MTCVIFARSGDDLLIAGDGLIQSEGEVFSRTSDKFRVYGGAVAVGYAGDLLISHDVFDYLDAYWKTGMDAWAVTRRLSRMFRDKDAEPKEDTTSFLIADKDCTYLLESNGEYLRIVDLTYGIGAGAPYALGFLDCIPTAATLTDLRHAIGCAAKYRADVGGEITTAVLK